MISGKMIIHSLSPADYKLSTSLPLNSESRTTIWWGKVSWGPIKWIGWRKQSATRTSTNNFWKQIPWNCLLFPLKDLWTLTRSETRFEWLQGPVQIIQPTFLLQTLQIRTMCSVGTISSQATTPILQETTAITVLWIHLTQTLRIFLGGTKTGAILVTQVLMLFLVATTGVAVGIACLMGTIQAIAAICSETTRTIPRTTSSTGVTLKIPTISSVIHQTTTVTAITAIIQIVIAITSTLPTMSSTKIGTIAKVLETTSSIIKAGVIETVGTVCLIKTPTITIISLTKTTTTTITLEIIFSTCPPTPTSANNFSSWSQAFTITFNKHKNIWPNFKNASIATTHPQTRAQEPSFAIVKRKVVLKRMKFSAIQTINYPNGTKDNHKSSL